MADIRASQVLCQVEWQDPQLLVFSILAQIEWTEPIAGWTGKVNGVTNPAKINGVVIASISKVMGMS